MAASLDWKSVEEWRKQHGLGRSTVYEAIRENRLPHCRVGRRILIPADALSRLMERRPEDEIDSQRA